MERITLRKPKSYFDVVGSPSHVTFDDGKEQRRNFPWSLYVEAQWHHLQIDTIKVEIGSWVVTVRGNNLGPLYQAIEEHTLLRLRAQPELQRNREHEVDTFAVEIRFLRSEGVAETGKSRPPELDLGLC